MSTGSRLPIGTLHAVLDEIGAVDPIYLTTAEKQGALTELSRARARIEAAELRVLAAADDIAEATGARSTADWLADETPSGSRDRTTVCGAGGWVGVAVGAGGLTRLRPVR